MTGAAFSCWRTVSHAESEEYALLCPVMHTILSFYTRRYYDVSKIIVFLSLIKIWDVIIPKR